MTNDEVFQYLKQLGFTATGGAGNESELRLGPITLRAFVSWLEDRVSLHGSYRDSNTLADTEGIFSRSVMSLLAYPTGLLPEDPEIQDIDDRIDQVLSNLPEPPLLARIRGVITEGRSESVLAALASGSAPPTLKLGRERGSMLHFARSASIVRLLASHGVDPDQPSRSGRTPLFEATDIALLEALLDAGASTDWRDREGRTVLHQSRSIKIIRRLIEAGADASASDNTGRTPLHYCVELPALACLLSAGAYVDAQDQRGHSALHTHLQADRVPPAVLLLTQGANPDLANANGETSIFFARSAMALQMLLNDYEASISIRSNIGQSALHLCRDAECAQMLCIHGLDADLADAEGCTPLHFCGSVGVARVLLSNGATVNRPNRSGQTPLHLAVARADHNVVFELLSKRANPNFGDDDGNTPLHLARTSAIARRLLDAGGDPMRQNKWGEAPAEKIYELCR